MKKKCNKCWGSGKLVKETMFEIGNDEIKRIIKKRPINLVPFQEGRHIIEGVLLINPDDIIDCPKCNK